MDYYCNSGHMSHISLKDENEYKIFTDELATKLKLYMSHMLQPVEIQNCITLLANTDNLLFNLIHDLLTDETRPTNKSKKQNLIMNLLNCFKYDTEHDFGIGSTREECKDPKIIKCITSLPPGVNLHNHLIDTINNIGKDQLKIVNTCRDEKKGIITDQCRNDFSSICYTIRDTKIKGLAKNVLDISTGGKTLYRALSSMIDPAGCSSKKLNGNDVLIHQNIELYIYNIGLIFYQTFFTDFRNTSSLFWIDIRDFDKFYEDKKFDINLIHNGNPIIIEEIIGGGSSPFSAQKICKALNLDFTKFTNTYRNFPPEPTLVRGFQLVLKGYGDFGQLFFTTFLYYTELSDTLKPLLYTDNAVYDNIIPFYNNCILETIDTFLACIGVYVNTPMILGTDTNWHHYIIDVNKRYAGKNVLEIYNIYNKVKISLFTIYNIYEENIKNNIRRAITDDTIYTAIQNDTDLKTISREYSDYYDQKIKLYIISSAGVYGTSGYSLIKIHGYLDNINIFKFEHISTDSSFWKIDGKYIDDSKMYPQIITSNEFKKLSRATKSDRYNRFVSSDIFCSYIEIVIQDKINNISRILQQNLGVLPVKILCQTKVYSHKSVIKQSAILIFRILKLGIFEFYVDHVKSNKPTSRPYITSHLSKLRILDETFETFVNYTKFIHNNLETMYYNINLIIAYLDEEKTAESTIPSYYSKIFQKYQNIVRSQNLNTFFVIVEQFYNYIVSEFNDVFQSLHNHISYGRLNDFDETLVQYNYDPKINPNSTYNMINYISELNKEIFDPTVFNLNDMDDITIKIITYIREKHKKEGIRDAFKLDKNTITQHFGHINTNFSYLRKYINYMNELKNYIDYYKNTVLAIVFPPSYEYITEIAEPDSSSSTPEALGTYYLKQYNHAIIWRFSNPNIYAAAPLCTKSFISYLIYVKFTSMFNYLSKEIIIGQHAGRPYFYENYIYLYNLLLDWLLNIVKNGGDTANKLIKESSEKPITISKFINNILLTGDGAGEENILKTEGCPVNIDYTTTLSLQHQMIIDKYIAYCIYNKYIVPLNDSNIISALAYDCIHDQKLYTGYSHGGGNNIFSKKITIYLKKIENIKNTIKLLKKNKILNRDKIIKNNKQIDDLKFKIKEEKKKEKEKKEKLKKEKEKKEKLKKEKGKKEKLKKEKKEKLKTNNSSKTHK